MDWLLCMNLPVWRRTEPPPRFDRQSRYAPSVSLIIIFRFLTWALELTLSLLDSTSYLLSVSLCVQQITSINFFSFFFFYFSLPFWFCRRRLVNNFFFFFFLISSKEEEEGVIRFLPSTQTDYTTRLNFPPIAAEVDVDYPTRRSFFKKKWLLIMNIWTSRKLVQPFLFIILFFFKLTGVRRNGD